MSTLACLLRYARACQRVPASADLQHRLFSAEKPWCKAVLETSLEYEADERPDPVRNDCLFACLSRLSKSNAFLPNQACSCLARLQDLARCGHSAGALFLLLSLVGPFPRPGFDNIFSDIENSRQVSSTFLVERLTFYLIWMH